ncbi:MAG: 2-oxoacid:acceptor oxidoreductase family protein [Candidatus Magasanikbacteria bacterium]
MKFKILLAGDGGQGVQTIAKIVSECFFAKNFEVSSIPNYGLEQRGGVSLSFIQVSDKQIFYPKFAKADFLLLMSEQARERTSEHVSADTEIIDFKNYQEIILQNKISRSSLNIFFLGVIAKFLSEKNLISKDDIFVIFEKKLASKKNWEENKQVFEMGFLI